MVRSNQRGVALLTVLLLLVTMTIIGIGAITMSGFGGRMAGFGRTAESGANAAESCIGTGVKLIQDTIDQGSVPAAYLSNANPAGPVPQSNAPTLAQEILGQFNNNPDTPQASPNISQVINGFTVTGDVDRLYAAPKSGSAIQFAMGYEGTGTGAAAGGVDIYYSINCIATNAASATSNIVAIYACTVTGESCQRRP